MGDRASQPAFRATLRPASEPPPARRVEDELRALIRVSSAVAAAHRLEEVLETVAEESLRILGAASVSISRWERDANRLRTLVNAGRLGPGEERWPAAELWPLDDFPHIPPLLEAGASYLVDAADPTIPTAEAEVLAQLGKGSCLRVPVVFEGATWGKLEAFSDAGAPAFTLAEAPFVEALATQVAVAIGRAELFSRLNELAYEDPLTGLANRRALEERLEAAVSRAATGHTAVALLFCDLDGLKELNDADGHEAGDAALVRVAGALRAAAAGRPGAFISRIGGDEFCVLLEGAGARAARELAVAALERLAGGDGPTMSMSCGAAELQHAGQRPADLFRAADAAQYVAKRAGRGRVYVAEAGAVAIADSRAQAAGERRRLREAQRPEGLTARVLERLDLGLAGAPAGDRLEAVAVAFADAYDASGWAVSTQDPGAATVRTVFEGGRRAHRVSGVPSLRFRGTQEYPLADYPATARVLARGGTFCVHADDPAADPAERTVLHRTGHHALVAAAVVDAGAAWLVELYADTATGAVETVAAELRLLCAEAVRGLPARPSGQAY
jgi:diguanylate cyclase (GGDEF)-like protein